MADLSPRLRFAILERDSFTCQYCGRRATDVLLHVDHVQPKSRGGSNRRSNLVTACGDCNIGKGARCITVPHPDRCRECSPWQVFAAAIDEWPVRDGYGARYRCPLGHTWTCAYWSHDRRLTPAELNGFLQEVHGLLVKQLGQDVKRLLKMAYRDIDLAYARGELCEDGRIRTTDSSAYGIEVLRG